MKTKQEFNSVTTAIKAGRRAVWSIGIFRGPTLSALNAAQGIEMPVLSARDVKDVRAEFLADPFMVERHDRWYMFFEVMNEESQKGEIGLAISNDCLRWEYQQIVLNEPFHLSYPYVFRFGHEYFMIPESYEANSMRLYRADPFPLRWSYDQTLLEGPWVDSSIFFFEDRWWVFSNPVAPENQVLELFYADSITGPWRRHPMSPLIEGNNRIARGAGRVIVNGKPVRFAQDCVPVYGSRVRSFEISLLTTLDYAERELEFSPILSAGSEFWRCAGMHHIDAHFTSGGWVACVDGWRLEERSAL